MRQFLDALRAYTCRALASASAKACRKSKVTLYQQRKEVHVGMFLILPSMSSVDYIVLVWKYKKFKLF